MRFTRHHLSILSGLLCLQYSTSSLATDGDISADYSSSEVSWSRGYGANIIDGIAAHTAGRITKTCAGEEVLLRPRSAFEDRRNKFIFGGLGWSRMPARDYLNLARPDASKMPAPPKAYDLDARRARCSIDGKFLFVGIPDGEYYAIVMVFPRKYLGKVTPFEEIEVLMRPVSIAGGTLKKLDLFAASKSHRG
jgi:hypothetical protein